MKHIHIVTGKAGAAPLTSGLEQEEVLVLEDLLHIGPLKTPGVVFSEARSQFWQELTGPADGAPIEVRDLENLMAISTRMSNNPELYVVYWMSNHAADLCAYFWLMHYLKKHSGRFGVIKIAGLPFIDDEGKLFYPESIGAIPLKEIPKARKLTRTLTPSEWETDIEEWQKMAEENAPLRIVDGGRQWKSVEADHYDAAILSLITEKEQKWKRVVQQLLQKSALPVNEAFLTQRLKQLAEAGKILLTAEQVKIAAETPA